MTISYKPFFFPLPRNDEDENAVKEYMTEHCFTPPSQLDQLDEEDSEELDENGFPCIKGWPAAAKSEADYWKLIQAYPGGTLTRSAKYVSNLLNDEKLNIPSSIVTLTTQYHSDLPLLDQTLLDLRRRDKIHINGKLIYDLSDHNDSVEVFIKDWSDADKAKHTFKECMTALHNNFDLTTNALKLSTQASLARLATLIMIRFNNQEIDDPKLVLCGVQRVEINTQEQDITRIFYHSYWGIITMENYRAPPLKHVKGSVEFVVGTNDLIEGKAGQARAYERCSQFFNTLEDVEQCGEWPAYAESASIYDKRAELLPNYREHLHPLTCMPIFKHITKKKRLGSAESIECALQSQYLPLKQLFFFDQEMYNHNSLISKLPNQGKFITEIIRKKFKEPKILTDKLCTLACLGLGELITKTAYLRFSKPSLDRHVTCYDFRLAINRCGDSTFRIEAISKWVTRDMSQDDVPVLSRFKLDIDATINEMELLSKKPEDIDIHLTINKLEDSVEHHAIRV
jgi:hypothetical protein